MHQEVGQNVGANGSVAGALARNGKGPGSSNGHSSVAPQLRPSKPLPRARPYASPWKIWLPIPLFLLLLDATFNLYFWRIPKLTGPGADWGYQFLIDVHAAQQPKPEHARRIVAFGSSISGSFDPLQVSGLLAASANGPHPDVHRLMLPGVHPADYRLFWEGEIDLIRPDVAVVMFNLLDFLSSSNPKEMNPAMIAALPPGRVLAERGDTLSTTEKLDWLVRGKSNLYRYSKVMRSSLQDHLKLLPALLLHRAAAHPYGVYADGYTQPQFAVPGTAGAMDFEYFVDPEWIRQRGQVELTFSADQRVLKQLTETEPGWKRVHLAMPSSAVLLHVSADGFWNRRVAGETDDIRLLGVHLRLPLAAGVVNKTKRPRQYPPFARGATHELLRMGGATGAEFAGKWNAVVDADNDFGKRFRIYRDEKLAIRELPFRAGGEYDEIEKLISEFAKRGTAIVMVNTPDSPWIAEQYQDSPYYQGYLQYFAGMAQRYPSARFVDLHAALPAEDFNDWHHPNYIGAIKLGLRYAQAIRETTQETIRENRAAGADY